MEPENYAGIESGMVFLGMAALEDPPRPEVKDAIEECTLAGIRVSYCPNPRATQVKPVRRLCGIGRTS